MQCGRCHCWCPCDLNSKLNASLATVCYGNEPLASHNNNDNNNNNNNNNKGQAGRACDNLPFLFSDIFFITLRLYFVLLYFILFYLAMKFSKKVIVLNEFPADLYGNSLPSCVHYTLYSLLQQCG